MRTCARFSSGPAPGARAVTAESLDALVRMLAPIVPHICHSLWQQLGHAEPVIDAAWPVVDAAALVSASMQIVVQVNGKLRARLELPADADREAMAAAALADDNVQKFMAGKSLRKQIVVPGKLVNLVVA